MTLETRWCVRPLQAADPVPAHGGLCWPAEQIRIWYKSPMHPDAAHPLLPLVSLAAGVFLLIAPRIVSFAVAVYLIVVGLLGLNAVFHIFK
jgi:hypothetical protein